MKLITHTQHLQFMFSNMENKHLLIYHKEDNDGVFSGALIYNYFKEHLKENNIQLFGTDYNELNKLWENREVYNWDFDKIIMTDISFNDPNAMQYLYEKFGNNFFWIDHHTPIIKESHNHKFYGCPGLRDSSNSAIVNAYKFFYKENNKIPELRKVLSAWDSFTFEREGYELKYVSKVNIGIKFMFDLDINKVINLLRNLVVYGEDSDVEVNKSLISSAYTYGDIILTAKEQEDAQLIANCGDFSWTVNGRTACALFVQGPSNSQIFKTVKDKVKNGVIFKRLKDGNWVISLYNANLDDTFHCGEYLKNKYNGGGHLGAAGCQISEKQFIEILKTHEI